MGECTMGAEPGEGPEESSYRRLDTGTEQVALGDGGEGGCQSLGHQASSFSLRLGSWTDTLNHRLRKQNPSPTARPQQTQLTAKPDFCAACRKRGKEEGAGGP